MQLISHLGVSPALLISPQMGIILALGVPCLILIVVIPAAARRGKLSVPIYALLALAAGAMAFGTGTLSGAHSVRGTPVGVVLSVLCFLLVAMAIGCFLSLLFYRRPSRDPDSTEDSTGSVPPAGEPGD